MVEISLADVECGVCKVSTGVARAVLGNKVVFNLIVDLGYFLCHFFIPYIGYIPSTCPGIIKQ